MSFSYNVYAAYFSPTNGTKRAIELLAKEFNNDYKLINLTNKDERIKEIVFSDKDLVIVAAPVYAGQIPQVEGLFGNLKGQNTPCIVMATYGNRHYDDTLAQLKNILEKKGFICIGGIASIIPHIYSQKLGFNRPDNGDIQIMNDFAKDIIKKIKENKLKSVELPGEKNPKPLSVNPGNNVSKMFNKELCSKCKICEKECPVGAINSESMEVNKSTCINCMKCSYVCKKNARKFDSSKVREYLETNYLDRRKVEIFMG